MSFTAVFCQKYPKWPFLLQKMAIFRPKVAILCAFRELRKKCTQSFDFWPKCPKMAIFAPKVAIFRPKVAILCALRELRKKCAQSFDFWPKMPENGHFCSKIGHFSPKSGHFSRKSPPPRAGGDYTSKSHPRRAQAETGPRKSHLRHE